MAGEYQFSLIEVTKQVGTKTILKDVNLSFFYGAHIGVIGGNGAGKSTQWCSGKESTCDAGEQETWVRSLGWEDPLEKGKATHSSILALRTPWTSLWSCKELDTTERLSFHSL